LGLTDWLAQTTCDVFDTGLGVIGIGPGNITPGCDIIAEQQAQTYGDPDNPYNVQDVTGGGGGLLGLGDDMRLIVLVLGGVLALKILRV